MAEYTRYQKKVIGNYYDNKDTIMVAKLSELVSELYLADTDKKRDKLWERAELAMKNLKWKDALISQILTRRSPEVLANHLNDWLGGK